MDRNLFNHCMVCGRKNDDTSHNYSGFHVHETCHSKVEDLRYDPFHSATVISHKDGGNGLDPRVFVVAESANNGMGWYTVTRYANDADYVHHIAQHVVDVWSYTAAIAHIVARFDERG